MVQLDSLIGNCWALPSVLAALSRRIVGQAPRKTTLMLAPSGSHFEHSMHSWRKPHKDHSSLLWLLKVHPRQDCFRQSVLGVMLSQVNSRWPGEISVQVRRGAEGLLRALQEGWCHDWCKHKPSFVEKVCNNWYKLKSSQLPVFGADSTGSCFSVLLPIVLQHQAHWKAFLVWRFLACD